MRVEEYRALVATQPTRRAQPEHALQCAVADALRELEKADQLHVFDWTSSLAGARLGKKTRGAMKRAGLRPGWPDLQFACHDGLVRFIELKTDEGSLSYAQRMFRAWGEPKGVWALCRSVGQVIDQLTAWGLIRP